MDALNSAVPARSDARRTLPPSRLPPSSPSCAPPGPPGPAAGGSVSITATAAPPSFALCAPGNFFTTGSCRCPDPPHHLSANAYAARLTVSLWYIMKTYR